MVCGSPMASIATSTPRPSVKCATFAARSWRALLMTSVTPKMLTWLSFSLEISAAMIFCAPTRRAP